MQAEPRVLVVEVGAEQLLDAVEPVVERLAAEVQRPRGLGLVAAVGAERLERRQQLVLAVRVVLDERAEAVADERRAAPRRRAAWRAAARGRARRRRATGAAGTRRAASAGVARGAQARRRRRPSRARRARRRRPRARPRPKWRSTAAWIASAASVAACARSVARPLRGGRARRARARRPRSARAPNSAGRLRPASSRRTSRQASAAARSSASRRPPAIAGSSAIDSGSSGAVAGVEAQRPPRARPRRARRRSPAASSARKPPRSRRREQLLLVRAQRGERDDAGGALDRDAVEVVERRVERRARRAGPGPPASPVGMSTAYAAPSPPRAQRLPRGDDVAVGRAVARVEEQLAARVLEHDRVGDRLGEHAQHRVDALALEHERGEALVDLLAAAQQRRAGRRGSPSAPPR